MWGRGGHHDMDLSRAKHSGRANRPGVCCNADTTVQRRQLHTLQKSVSMTAWFWAFSYTTRKPGQSLQRHKGVRMYSKWHASASYWTSPDASEYGM